MRPLGLRLQVLRRPPARVRSGAFLAAFLLFAGTGVYLRLQDEPPPEPEPVTVGDLVRLDFVGTLPTATGLEEWRQAFAQFGLIWVEDGALQTERPSEMLVFDDAFDGYAIGRGSIESTDFTSVIGFEGDAVAWFACRVYGPSTDMVDLFFEVCWDAAAVSGADRDAGAEWIATTLALEIDESDIISRVETFCPAAVVVFMTPGLEYFTNAQVTIASSPNC